MVGILLGHLVGDYLLQNKWMAMNKSASSIKCLIHCILYTLAVCVFTNFHPAWIAIVFASHFIIDRWSLADKWLYLIEARSLRDFIDNGLNDIPFHQNQSFAKFWNYHSLRGGFTSIVYTVADNTMHLLLMYAGWTCLKLS
jgi:hypothetical protein